MNYELERTQKNKFLAKKIQCRIKFTSDHPASSNVCMQNVWCLYTFICDLIYDCMLLDEAVCSVRSLPCPKSPVSEVSRVRSLPSLPYCKYDFFLAYFES